MLSYLLKRLLFFVPTLVIISLLAFGLSRCAPGDPVECYLPLSADDRFSASREAYERAYLEQARKLGLDRPVFYLGLSSAAYPDTLYRFVQKEQRKTLRKLIAQYGNWREIEAYYLQIGHLERALATVPDSVGRSTIPVIRPALRQLPLLYKEAPIQVRLDTIAGNLARDSALAAYLDGPFTSLADRYRRVREKASPWRLYVPDLKWYGIRNQYHFWISSFLRGDMGRSCRTDQPVFETVMDYLKWTLILNGLAIGLAYALSVPLGVLTAARRGSAFDRATTLGLFFLYSLPSFWIATLLVVFFTTPAYGMDWFPSMGLGDLPPDAPFRDRFRETAVHLILPVFCLTYGVLAFITRQMRAGMLHVIGQDYIRTARAKGLGERVVIWKHAFRNSLFPIITLFAGVFPASLAGSVVIEVVFNIPGMGRLLVQSIVQQDWPVVYLILMMGAVLTMVGILIADLLYALADPRVSFGKK